MREPGPGDVAFMDIVLNSMSEHVVYHDRDLRVVWANRAACEALALDLDHIRGHTCHSLWHQRSTPCPGCPLPKVIENGVEGAAELEMDGRTWSIRGYPVRGPESAVDGVVEISLEITEQTRLRERVRESERLESLGMLAGGIAHDFNNLLTGILGNASLALAGLPPGSAMSDAMREIETLAVRASELTRHLLAVAGRGCFDLRVADLSRIVDAAGLQASALMPAHTTLRMDLRRDLPSVEADAPQVRQAVLNLIVNAIEAMGDRGGEIRVRTGALEARAGDLANVAGNTDLPEGLYVFAEVTDTGCGMDEATRARIFDPFFSTKFMGRGLGLPAAIGVIRGHGGGLQVESTPGSGSSFRILLPATRGRTPVEVPVPEVPWRGQGTILVVDDEESVLLICRRMLEDIGFSTLAARDGVEAVEVFQANADRIAAVLLDLTMPRMGGLEARRRIQAIRPGVRILLSSGYGAQEASERLGEGGLGPFLEKPYRLHDLREQLRMLMEGT